MAERSICQVKRVIEVPHSSEGVNEKLGEGWILLLVYSESVAADNGPSQYPVYVLGWPRDGESPSEERDRIASERGREFAEELKEMNRSFWENNPDASTEG